MRRLLALTIAALLLAASFAGSTAHASAAAPKQIVVTALYGAALHLAPASDSDIYFVAGCGELFDVTGSNGGWYSVNAGTHTYWIGGARVADAAYAFAVDCAEAQTFQPGELVLTYVASGCLSLRSTPSRSSTMLDCVENGYEYKVQGGPIAAQGEDWIPVWSDATGSGWVLARYLQPEFPHT